MEQSSSNPRNVYGNQFGDNAWVNQGDTHIHLPSSSTQPKAIRVIPYPPNEDLVQRPDLLNRLETLLPSTSKHCKAAIWGLGGSGKTQIALEYAYRRSEEEDCSVYWIHADSEATFVQDYQRIAKKFGINTKLKTEDLLDNVRECIERQSKWVLIMDNADDLSLFGVGENQTTSLTKYIPQGTVLWTSRDQRIVGSLVSPRRGIEVAQMKVEEAEELLLLSRNEEGDGKDADSATLLEELEWLPLAIAQAGAFMRRTQTSVKVYLELLAESENRWKVLSITESDRHRRPDVPNSILKTWSISINRLKEENELAFRLFHVIPYLDYSRVPFEMLLAASEWKGMEKMPTKPDKLAVLQAITRLKEFSFVSLLKLENDERAYEMHKLVQEAARYGLRVRETLTMDDGENTCESNPADESEQSFSRIAIKVVRELSQTPEDIRLCWEWVCHEKYLTHAMRIGHWAKLCGMELEIGYQHMGLSNSFQVRGRMSEAIVTALEGRQLLQKILKKEHPVTIRSTYNLGTYYQGVGLFREAEDSYNEAAALCLNVSENTDELRIWIKHSLASLYDHQSRFSESKRLKFKLLNDCKKKFGEHSPEAIMNMIWLANTYLDQDLVIEANNLIRRAIRLSSSTVIHDPSFPNHCADVFVKQYISQGRYTEAEHFQVRLLYYFFYTNGFKCAYLAHALQVLADICYIQNRVQEALFLGFVLWSVLCELVGKHNRLPRTALKIVFEMASGYSYDIPRLHMSVSSLPRKCYPSPRA